MRAPLSSGQQSGFAIVAAIFLLVILAALGAFMLTMSSTQHVTSAQDLQATRAYWAAKAGIQWAAATIKTASACASTPPGNPLVIEGFSVVVKCTERDYIEGVSAVKIYWVAATATVAGTNVGDIAYIEREVNAFIEF